MINVGLNEVRVGVVAVVARGDFYCLTEVHRHDLTRAASRQMKGMATCAAARVENSLADKRTCREALEVPTEI